jgi:hypothetical protein
MSDMYLEKEATLEVKAAARDMLINPVIQFLTPSPRTIEEIKKSIEAKRSAKREFAIY